MWVALRFNFEDMTNLTTYSLPSTLRPLPKPILCCLEWMPTSKTVSYVSLFIFNYSVWKLCYSDKKLTNRFTLAYVRYFMNSLEIPRTHFLLQSSLPFGWLFLLYQPLIFNWLCYLSFSLGWYKIYLPMSISFDYWFRLFFLPLNSFVHLPLDMTDL